MADKQINDLPNLAEFSDDALLVVQFREEAYNITGASLRAFFEAIFGGAGIKSVEQTTTSAEDGGSNVITVTLTDGKTATFNVKNGSKGSPGVTPHIGTNGNWYLGTTDTGVAATAGAEAAETAAASAQASAEAAENAESSAQSAYQATYDLVSRAQQYERQAGNSASLAYSSADSAHNSKNAAATSETNAGKSATAAANSATAAQSAKTAAETAKSEAETVKSDAETAKTAAETARSEAETAKSDAESAKAAAKTSETNAKTSETNAKTSETNAKTSETNAASSASSASSSANAAASSATNAANAASKAQGYRDEVAEMLENVEVDPSDAVLVTEQTLTEEQKAQARDNIGAATVDEVLAALPTWTGGSY